MINQFQKNQQQQFQPQHQFQEQIHDHRIKNNRQIQDNPRESYTRELSNNQPVFVPQQSPRNNIDFMSQPVVKMYSPTQSNDKLKYENELRDKVNSGIFVENADFSNRLFMDIKKEYSKLKDDSKDEDFIISWSENKINHSEVVISTHLNGKLKNNEIILTSKEE